MTGGPKVLQVKNGRYVCPVCRAATQQKASSKTQARNLLLWCRHCKREFCVNIDCGQCSVIAGAQ